MNADWLLHFEPTSLGLMSREPGRLFFVWTPQGLPCRRVILDTSVHPAGFLHLLAPSLCPSDQTPQLLAGD